jgi:hypothetical protein
LPSSAQAVPLVCLASEGQVVLVPEQVSATSQAPAEARHTVPALPAGCWQTAFEPSHWSLVQGLPSSVQAVPLAFLASEGQVAEVPEQVSATSHSPVEARHTVPALPAGCWQAAFEPSHWSLVQGLPSSVQAVPLAFLASEGQVAEEPVQVSARSHSPAAARQTVEDEAKALAGQSSDVPLQLSATSHAPAEGRQVGPAATGEQVPTLPGRVQDAQAFVQAVLQQTPLTQVRPTAHWLLEAQAPPWVWNVHAPLAQIPGQLWLACDAQSPAPSQIEAGVRPVEGAPLAQEAAWHCVPKGHFAHCPAWHWPVFPQVDWTCAPHIPCGSALAVIPTQVPRLPAMLQEWQAVLQALLQQTPCAHCPLWHWLAVEHGWPTGFLPHELTPPIPQEKGARHCESSEQAP